MSQYQEEEEYRAISRELLEFIANSPTCFHAVANGAGMLENQGYRKLLEGEDWRKEEYFRDWREGRKRGEGKFYVTRNDSSLIALHIPAQVPASGPSAIAPAGVSSEGSVFAPGGAASEPSAFAPGAVPWKGFHIAASHGDSPCFKVKENPEMLVENQYVKLNVEKYGGMIPSSWFDRALSVAGRLIVREGEGLETRLVNLKEELLVIPNVAVHLTRDAGKGTDLNAQVDLLPLYGGRFPARESLAESEESRERKELQKCEESREPRENVSLLARAARAAGVEPERICGQDLFLYVNEPGRFLGTSGEFLLSPRLDDQQCVFASLKGFLEGTPQEYLNVCAVFDNEEVGSGSRQGADSDFLEGTLCRLCEALGLGEGEYRRLVAGGLLLSADNVHGVHPNHPEKSDPTNRPYLNGGIVLKFQGSQKYTTDGLTAARVRQFCERAGVPCQTYANRSDISGGSTLGRISVAHVSIPSADIGLPQLAMHSAVETAGARDTDYGIRLFRTFWSE